MLKHSTARCYDFLPRLWSEQKTDECTNVFLALHWRRAEEYTDEMIQDPFDENTNYGYQLRKSEYNPLNMAQSQGWQDRVKEKERVARQERERNVIHGWWDGEEWELNLELLRQPHPSLFWSHRRKSKACKYGGKHELPLCRERTYRLSLMWSTCWIIMEDAILPAFLRLWRFLSNLGSDWLSRSNVTINFYPPNLPRRSCCHSGFIHSVAPEQHKN